jgi:hypothetical protein
MPPELSAEQRVQREEYQRAHRALVRILRRAHRHEVDMGDLLSAALMDVAAKVGGPDEVVKYRSGSWEAEHVFRLAGGL